MTCFRCHDAFLSPAGTVGPGTGYIATPPVRPSVCLSICPSVTFSFRTVTQKRIALSPAGAVGPGTGEIATPPVRPSVCPSVTFSFRTVAQKRIAIFSRNLAGTCTKSWGCIVFDIDGMLFEFFKY